MTELLSDLSRFEVLLASFVFVAAAIQVWGVLRIRAVRLDLQRKNRERTAERLFPTFNEDLATLRRQRLEGLNPGE